MRRHFSLIIALLLSSALFAQREVNDANAQMRNVKGFHAIKVSHGIELLLTHGSSEAVAVSASDPEFRNKIKTVVDNGVLRIYYDNNFLRDLSDKRRKNLKAYVSFINLDGLDGSSGASIRAEAQLNLSKLELELSSGATFSGKVEAGSLSVDQSSGSVVNISGTVNSLKVEGSSGSIFRGFDLEVDNCAAETSSGSGVQVSVNKELTAEASSGGYISYKGSGVITNIRTSSGGSVSRKS